MLSSLFSIDYNSEIQPIFDANCGNCHLGNSSGGINLSNYQNTMSSDIIIPGNASSSSLYDRITRDNSDTGDMPPGNAELSSEQISLIESWINEGALPDENFCNVSPGDVNGDSILNVLDVVLLAQYILGMGTLLFECAADFNGDLVLNVLDVVQLINEILS
tara:strand:- start:126 stop:611 length:486 start_codon:yes stop_codon:yes gene_type:complete